MKTLPQAIEAECAILGACLQFPQAVCIAAQEVNVDDFHNASNRSILAAVFDLSRRGHTIDLVTVANALMVPNDNESKVELSYLSSLTEYALGWTATKEHCRIVRDKAIGRAAIALSAQLQAQCFGGLIAKDAVEHFVSKIALLNRGGSNEPSTVAKVANRVLEKIDRIADGRESYGIQTGFIDIDRRIVGMAKGDLIIIAARPSMGKTALAMNIACNVAKMGIPTLVFSLEMSEEQLVSRQISAKSMVSGDAIRKGIITDAQRQQIARAAGEISAMPILINDRPGLSIQEIQSVSRFANMKTQIGLIVVDYIQLVKSSVGKNGTREQEVSAISRGLKGLAKDIGCPVIGLSQLNRGLENRTDKRPMMSDLRESGAIEQDADVIMFIYRDDFYNKQSPIPGQAEILIRKQRNGPTGDELLLFQGEFSRFLSLQRKESC